MPNSLISVLQSGQAYGKVWPNEKELWGHFPENRVISATQFSISWFPMLAVLSFFVQVYYLGAEYLPQALTVSIFILSMPLQGLYWLGKRSDTVLPPVTANWYREIHSKMAAQGCQVNALKARPKYFELACLLKRAYDEMDRAFTSTLYR